MLFISKNGRPKIGRFSFDKIINCSVKFWASSEKESSALARLETKITKATLTLEVSDDVDTIDLSFFDWITEKRWEVMTLERALYH